LLDTISVRIAEKEPARLAPDLAEFLTRLAYRRRVNDGQGLLDILRDQRIEKRLVCVLKIPHEPVFFDRRCQARQPVVPTVPLILQAADVGGQETVERERVALALDKGGSLVESRIVEKVRSGEVCFHDVFPFVLGT
jgi:hypothetical protein